MTPVVLVALILALQDPVIEEVHTLTGGAARAGCWLPISVTVSSPGAFDGDVALVADPITVAQAVHIAPGEKRAVVVPALPWMELQAIEVQLRSQGRVRARRGLDGPIRWLKDEERLVLEAPPGWRDLDPALFEAADAVEGADWTPRARIGVIAPGLAPLRIDEPWIRAKRDAAILFVIIYAFAGFVIMLAALRRQFGSLVLVLLAVAFSGLFAGGFFAFFPRGHVAVQAWGAVAEGLEYRLHVVRGGRVTFARPAKPLFESAGELGPVEVRFDRGWTVTGAEAALTVDAAPEAKATRQAGRDDADVRFFASRLGAVDVARIDERDPPLTGVSAPGLVEARLAPRLVIRRR